MKARFRLTAVLFMVSLCFSLQNSFGERVFTRKWGTFGTGDAQFDRPRLGTIDSLSNVCVVDSGNARIQKFNSTGTFILKWGSPGTGVGQFQFPTDAAFDTLGNIYVADQSNHRIQKFSPDGTFITQWGGFGAGNGQFNFPNGVAIDSSNNVYVADSSNNQIQKFTVDGTFLAKWGSLCRVDTGFGCNTLSAGAVQPGDGQFRFPRDIAVDPFGNVYVADSSNQRIQKFTTDGVFVAKWGRLGSADGEFNDSRGIAVDSAGDVYVADSSNNRIQKFTQNGAFIEKFGSPGSGNGQFNFPSGIAFDAFDNIYISDQFNHRIQVFAPANDIMPPSTITDLAPISVTTSSIALLWTSPGDDGTIGKVASYDLRYATFPISNLNFSFATPVAALPLPKIFGSTVSFTVGFLAPSSTYFFAIKSIDDFGNASEISNIASTTTSASLTPEEFIGTALSTASILWSWNDVIPEDGYRLISTTGVIVAHLLADSTFYIQHKLQENTSYSAYIQAFNSTGFADSSIVNRWTLANPAINFSAANISSVSTTLTWMGMGKTKYRLERSTDGLSWNFISITSVAASAFTDIGLTPETTYFYRLGSLNGEDVLNQNHFSNIVSTRTKPKVPAAPTGFAGIALSTISILWSWTDNAVNELGYRVLSVTGGIVSENLPPNTTFFIQEGLERNTSYAAFIQVFNLGGASNSSLSSRWTLAEPPQDLIVTEVSSVSIALGWTSSANSKYQLERSSNEIVWSFIAKSTASSFRDVLLVPEMTYFYRLRAINGEEILNEVAFSNIASTRTKPEIPFAPAGFTGIALSTSEILWSWLDQAVNEDGYHLMSSSGGKISPDLPPNTTFFAQAGLSLNTSHSAFIEAFNITGISDSSATLRWTLAEPPSDLSAVEISSVSITLNWTGFANTKYRVEKSINGLAWNFLSTTAIAASQFVDTGLSPETTYFYRLGAINGEDILNQDLFSNVASTRTKPEIPVAPSNLIGIAFSTGSILWSWSDNANNEEGYRLISSTGGSISEDLDSNTTFFIQARLQENTSHSAFVEAFNVTGIAVSSVDTVWTLANPPMDLVVASVSSISIILNWIGMADTKYQVQRSADGIAWIFISTTGIAASQFTDVSLSPETTYFYRLGAINGQEILNHTAFSNVVSTQTKPETPLAPMGLTGLALTTTSILWTWTDNAINESGYRVVASSGGAMSPDLPANTTFFVQSSLSPNSLSSVFAEAFNSVGSSRTVTVALHTLANNPTETHVVLITSTTIVISWSNNGNPTDTVYETQISTAIGFSQVNLATSASLTTTFLNLLNDTTYYLRVRAKNGDNIFTTFDNVVSTKIILPMLAPFSPGLISPSNNSFVNKSQPTFVFSESDPNVEEKVRFGIEISTSPAPFSLNGEGTVVSYISAVLKQGTTSFTVGQADGGSYLVGNVGQTLPEGTYFWRVKTVDETGLESSFSSSFQLSIDTTPPQLAILQPTEGQNVRTFSLVASVNETINIDGILIDGATRHISCDLPNTFINPSPNLVCNIFETLPDGIHTVQLAVSDRAGNISAAASTFKFDTTPPSAIGDLSAESGTGNGEITLNWTARGDDGTIGQAKSYILEYSLFPRILPPTIDLFFPTLVSISTLQVSGQKESVTLKGLTAGVSYFFQIRADDTAGNSSARSNMTSAIPPGDPVYSLPSPQLISPVNAQWLNTGQPSLIFNIFGSSTNSFGVRYRIQISTTQDFSFNVLDAYPPVASITPPSMTYTVGGLSWSYLSGFSGMHLNPGNYYWRVMSIDFDGLISSWTSASGGNTAFRIDKTPPLGLIEDPKNNSQANGVTAICGTAYDSDSGIDHVEVEIMDQNTNQSTSFSVATGTHHWAISVSSAILFDGHSYLVNVKTHDVAGNVGLNSSTFLIDTSLPLPSQVDFVKDLIFASGSSSTAPFRDPGGVALDSLGNIYITDIFSNESVQIYDSQGNFLRKFGEQGSAAGQFNQPLALTLDLERNIYVADTGNRRIQKFDFSGAFLWQRSLTFEPLDIVFDKRGNIFVVDSSGEIRRYDQNGNIITTWSAGSISPSMALAADSSGNIYVAGNPIRKFDSAGTLLQEWTIQNFIPKALAAGPGDYLYVAVSPIDSSHSSILKLNCAKQPIASFDDIAIGDLTGKIFIGKIATDVHGNIFVAKSLGSIRKFNSPVIDVEAPQAFIILSPSSPVKSGDINVSLFATEVLSSTVTPTLSFTPKNHFPISVPLQNPSGDRITWTGMIHISPETGDGSAQFAWSGTDRAGNIGTEILSGGEFFIDANPPAAITNLTASVIQKGTVQLFWTAPSDFANLKVASYDVRFASFVLMEQNFDQGTTLQISLIPQNAGNIETALIDGLSPTTYYFAIKSADSAGNVSVISNQSVIELNPPSMVTDLRVASMTGASMTLLWTAPGDDGTEGQVAQYNLRYSLSQIITDTDYENALEVAGLSAPQSSGLNETFLVSGLNSDTTYYFSLKSRDSEGNISNLSNGAARKTQDVIPPASITDLRVVEVELNSMVLNWTASGDNANNGQSSQYDLRYSTLPIEDLNFFQAKAVTVPSPQFSGFLENFRVLDLAPKTTYHFAIRILDEAGNSSQLSNVATAFPDTIPPATIDDLRVFSVELTSITLNWSSPGDDRTSGRAARYDLRYSSSPLSGESDFINATPIAQLPVPKTSGSHESFTVTGLSHSTTYFFAIKTIDEADNTSALSNVTSTGTNIFVGIISSLNLKEIFSEELTLSATTHIVVNCNYGPCVPLMSQNILQAGVSYILEGRGTFFAGIWADALTRGILMDGNFISWENNTPNTDHVYRSKISGTGGQAAFRINDDFNHDNSGFCTIRVFRVEPTIEGVVTLEAPVSTTIELVGLTSTTVSIALSSATTQQGLTLASAVYELGPPGTVFEIPATLTFSYDPAKVTDPTQLKIYKWNGSEWISAPITNQVIDTVNHTVTGQILSLSFYALFEPDKVPPSLVNNLQSTPGAQGGSIILTWTASGDDGREDKASNYDIRFALSPIFSDSDFANASKISPVPEPSTSGSFESITVNNLNPGTTYYFAMKVIDESGNISNLSNLTSARATPVDITAPITNLVFLNGREFTDPQGNVFVSTGTKVSFNAKDPIVDGAASDVRLTEFIIDSSTFTIFKTTFTEQFVVDIQEGRHLIQVRSQDYAGNIEILKSIFVFVDGSAPAIVIHSPPGGERFIAKTSKIKVDFSVSDNLDMTPSTSAYLRKVPDDGYQISVTHGQEVEPLDIPSGFWSLRISATDFVGNFASSSAATFEVIHDTLPPLSQLAVNGIAVSKDDKTFITSQTSFVLSAKDDLIVKGDKIGLGVSEIHLAIDTAGYQMVASSPAGSNPLTSLPFNLLGDGIHTLSFFSTDIIGSRESTQTVIMNVDNTAPLTAIGVQGPQFVIGTMTFINGGSRIEFSAQDPVVNSVTSDVKETFYSIRTFDYSGTTLTSISDSPFQLYLSSSFPLSEGVRQVSFFSRDNLLNTEITQAKEFKVDATSPSVSLSFTEGRQFMETMATESTGKVVVKTFVSGDTGYKFEVQDTTSNNVISQAKQIEISIDSAPFTLFSGTFAVIGPCVTCISSAPFSEGVHMFRYHGEDFAGNVSVDSIAIINVDRTVPKTQIHITGMQVESGGKLFVTTATSFNFSAEDPLSRQVASGVKKSYFSLDNAPFAVIPENFTLSEGVHTIQFFSIDNVENSEPVQSLTVYVDNDAPSTILVISSKSFSAFGTTYISPWTPLAFKSNDPDSFGATSGIKKIEFKVTGPSISSNFMEYFSSFTLLGLSTAIIEGIYLVQYRAIDLTGNIETAKSQSLSVILFPDFALIGTEWLKLGGQSQSMGDIGSNGKVKVEGQSEVTGSVYGESVRLEGQAKVSGQIVENVLKLSSVPIDLVAISSSVTQNNDNSKIPKTENGNIVLNKNLKFKMEGKDKLNLPPGTYFFNGIEFSGESVVNIAPTGTVNILCAGKIKISGKSGLNAGGLPSNMIIFVDKKGENDEEEENEGEIIGLEGESQLSGIVYAPFSKVNISDSAKVWGNLFAKMGELEGASSLSIAPDANFFTGSGKKLFGANEFVKQASTFPTDFVLGEVYAFPNPATPGYQPTIHIECGIADSVEIRIYNIAGELMSSDQLAGNSYQVVNNKYAYEYSWQSSGIASGVYVYVVQAKKSGAQDIKVMKKLAVIK